MIKLLALGPSMTCLKDNRYVGDCLVGKLLTTARLVVPKACARTRPAWWFHGWRYGVQVCDIHSVGAPSDYV